MFLNRTKIFVWAVAAALFPLPVAFSQHIDVGARQLTQKEGAVVLSEFRKYRLPEDYCMQIEIIHKPRRDDDEKIYAGTMWGTWIDGDAYIRLEIGGRTEPTANRKRFLIRSGKTPALWMRQNDGSIVKVDKNSTKPFFEDLIFTPFDLQTPFLFWENFRYDATKRSRGRPVHFFTMFPPEKFSADNPNMGSVKLGFDRAYNALVRVEVCGIDGKTQKTFSLGSVQKVQGMYTFKNLELRDENSRDKDTLEVRSAALHLKLDPAFFEPSALSEPPPRVPPSSFFLL